MPADRSTETAIDSRALKLVEQALELPESEQESWLDTAGSSDAALLAAARELLSACRLAESDPDFLRQSAGEFAGRLIDGVVRAELAQSDASVAVVRSALAGRYEYVRELGRGGTAVVFLAKDLKHGHEVAIKVIHQGLTDAVLRSRFTDEIRYAAQLRHPYIVSLIDSGEAGDAGTLYYVMQYVDGETVRQRLDREGPLAFDDALAIVRDVAETLDLAHARGVVHRDIKPQNVLLGSGHAMVADFGIAVAIQSTASQRVTGTGIAVGTPAYMSPEQATASKDVDGRSDVYSLGCLAYEMLAGEPPYSGSTPQAVIAKHLSAPIPDLAILRPWAADGVSQAVQKALAKSPADRYRSAGEFVRALAGGYVPKPKQRTRSPAVLALLFLLAAAVVIWTARDWNRTARVPAVAGSARDLRRIAVLYFDDLAADPEMSRLASGLTEDIIDELAQVGGLFVVSPNGVRPFRSRAAPVDSIAATLGVGTLVGGSVSASQSVVRASVRIIDPVTGRQLQSRSFEEARAQTLVLRDRVVTQVATFLRERLGQEVRLREQLNETRSVEAWRVVQDAQEIYRQGAVASREGRDNDAIDLLTRADSLYQQAENADSRWVVPVVGRGWVSLALALTRPPVQSARGQLRSDEAVDERTTAAIHMMLRAIAHANRGLQRSAGAPQALALRGMAHQRLALLTNFGNTDSLQGLAEADLRAALDARPDDARSWYAAGELYFASGRFSEATEALAKAYEADAFLTEARAVVSQAFFAALSSERFDDARRWCVLGRARYSGDPRFATCELILLGWTGHTGTDVSAAWRHVDSIERHDSVGMFTSQWSFLRMMVASVAVRAGMRDSALAILAHVQRGVGADPRRGESPDAEASVRLQLGQREYALSLLARAVIRAPQIRRQLARSPQFKELRGDSGFVAITTARSPRRPEDR